MSRDLSHISFDDIFKTLHRTRHDLKKATTTVNVTSILAPLKKICSSIGSAKPYKPLFVPEEYRKQWKDYLGNGMQLKSRAMRYLCWDADIASDKRFLKCIASENMLLSARSLQGLVRACHLRWSSVIQGSDIVNGSLLTLVRGMLTKYNRTNKIIQKWKSSPEYILTIEAPQHVAADMIQEHRAVDECYKSWGIDVQSDFFTNYVMREAVIKCRREAAHLQYLFDKLLSWKGWQNQIYKETVSSLILDSFYSGDAARELLQTAILTDDRLGDPRLHKNHHKWVDLNVDARNRFIQWLSRADITFFFEHVLPPGGDPHGRKEFWLKYLKKFRNSRPMLCQRDETRLRMSSETMRNKINMANFGRIHTDNSVFLLVFDSIVAVEFSLVGASYIYKADVFNQFFKDFYSQKAFNESHFKQSTNIGRVIHDRQGRWKIEMGNILARNGVRPY